MAPDRLREQLRAMPFRPFPVEFAGGKRIPVIRPDFALRSPAGRTLIVYTDPQDSRMEIGNVFSITDLSVEAGSEAAG